MKSGLWVVIIVVGSFMGFLMGYSLPPMIEVGMIGGGEKQEIGIQTEVTEDMQEYYNNLLKE
ncbi:hypothetical protein [Kaarinaea lacus]